MFRLLAVATVAAAQPSQPELQHFKLLQDLRRAGFTCPGGRRFPPNPAPFAWDCRVWAAARAHSDDMVARKYFSHVNPDGKDPCDRTRSRGLQACSENIAAGQSTPQAALDAFKASPEHCPNMLDPALNRAGIGYASSPTAQYRFYWTQNMGTSSGPPDASCTGGAASPKSCEDLNPNCYVYKGYAGTPWCNEAQNGWARDNCPKTCGLC